MCGWILSTSDVYLAHEPGQKGTQNVAVRHLHSIWPAKGFILAIVADTRVATSYLIISLKIGNNPLQLSAFYKE